jgi:hypothetical protein
MAEEVTRTNDHSFLIVLKPGQSYYALGVALARNIINVRVACPNIDIRSLTERDAGVDEMDSRFFRETRSQEEIARGER